jgi:hypothetical protein
MRRYPNHSLSFHVESFVLIVSVVLILICCFVVLLTYTMFALSHFALHLMHDMSVCLSYHILRCFPCAYDVCLTTFCVASLMHTMFALSHFALLPLRAYDVCLIEFCVASLAHTMFGLSHFSLLPLCIRCLPYRILRCFPYAYDVCLVVYIVVLSSFYLLGII